MMKMKRYATVLVPICLVTFLFRALELILSIDPRTGSFTPKSILPTAFNVALILFTLLLATVMFTKKEPKPVAVRLYRASLFDLIVGIAAAVSMIAASLFEMIPLFFTPDFSLAAIFASLAFWRFLLAFAGGTFLIFFVTYPRGTIRRNVWKIFSLSLTAYFILLLLANFNDFEVVFSQAFGIYTVTFYAIAALASVSLSKIFVRLVGRRTFVLFTCLMSMLMALRLADAVIYLLPGNPYAIPMDLFTTVTDLLVTLLFLSQMKKVMKNKKKRRRPDPDQEGAEPAVPEEEPAAIPAPTTDDPMI